MTRIGEPTSLPPEVQRMIFELLPKSVLKDARLANKQWNVEAAKALWSETTIDIFAPRSFENLLTVPSGGILDNVRKLSIVTEHRNLNKINPAQAYTRLLELLTALPRDCLATFLTRNFVVKRDVLNVLLRTQSHLLELSICVEGEDQRVLPGAYLTRGSLTKLRSLQIIISGISHNIYRSFPAWLQHASSLQDLEIYHQTVRIFEGWTVPVLAPMMNLRTLSLHWMALSEAAAVCITTAIHLPGLHSLKVVKCSNVSLLFEMFAKRFRQSNNGSLKSFVYEGCDSQDNDTAIADLFGSTRGLSVIALEVGYYSELPKLSSISTHAGSLRELKLIVNMKDLKLTSRDAEYIAAELKCLERLLFCLRDLQLSLDQDRSRLLTVLARISTLKRLSLMVDFWEDNDGDTDDAGQLAMNHQLQYARVAGEIMECLVKHGSNVDILDFGHKFCPIWDAEADENGHTWPSYSYRKGEIWTEVRGRRQFVKTTVVPIPAPQDGIWLS